MSNPPIKAAAKNAETMPFYLVQMNGSDKRYVVSLNDKTRIRILLAGFINSANETVEVKIRDFKTYDEPADYSGSMHKSELHALMTKYEDFIFHNGYHDLMFRIPESGEYICFDEHGLVFIYTGRDCAETLKQLQAAYKPGQKLIYEFDHWHYSLPNGPEKLADLIEEFGLKKE